MIRRRQGTGVLLCRLNHNQKGVRFMTDNVVPIRKAERFFSTGVMHQALVR